MNEAEYSLPKGWDTRRLRLLSKKPIKNGIGEAANQDDRHDPRYIRITDIGHARTLKADTFRSLPLEVASEAPVFNGDILLAAVGATFGKSVLINGLDKLACYAGYLVKFTPGAEIDASFAAFWTESQHYWDQVRAEVIQSTIQNFSAAKYRNLIVPVPPLKTQRRIAAFLDKKTTQIDELIEKKRALLDRLAERRQATITQAVTKGLNSATPMKDSGIDWLGQIPEHWQVKRLNSFCYFQSGKAHEPFITSDGNYVCVNARFISTDGVIEKHCTENLCPATLGDILMVMSDLPNGRALARTFLTDDRAAYAVNQRVCRIRLRRGSPKYFSYQLNRHSELLRYDDGNEQTHLPNSAFKQLLLLVPSLIEQSQIAAYLDTMIELCSQATRHAERSLNLLQEYRSALITAAVTGQIEGLR